MLSYKRIGRPTLIATLFAVSSLVGCGGSKSSSSSSTAAPSETTASLTLGGYTTPREAYGEILPAFRAQWSKAHPAGVEFKESYLGSGAQARAIIGGFEADIAALSLEPDIETIKQAGLITHDWKARPEGGMVSRSIVVIGVREGNPKGIEDWDDLAKPGISVLTPNVRTSGGARWNIAAIWGAALRGKTGAAKDSPEAATKLLSAILKNVKNMDPGARESLLNFERGVGDAIITYENEILVGKQKGQKYEYVIPKSTILIENPAAIVDSVVNKHGSRAAATALLDFLIAPEAQRIYAKHGLRPVNAEVAKEVAANYPNVEDLFTIRDIGDWSGVQKVIFETGSAYDDALSLAGTP
ncbi:MAG TPA: sulfate ABC transporter substrate-binding protein [Polyangiales bacterium]|nr:sulfate ABC transporter substrate-binding protein [Polyangiales bacterium]